jgi:hypothetical protein
MNFHLPHAVYLPFSSVSYNTLILFSRLMCGIELQVLCKAWQFWTAFFLRASVIAKQLRDFWLVLVWNLIEEARSFLWPCQILVRSFVLEKRVTPLEVECSNHWPVQSSRLRCFACCAWVLNREDTHSVRCVMCYQGVTHIFRTGQHFAK